MEELDKARFYVALRGDLATKDKLIGWRIDDLAGLAITISLHNQQEGASVEKRR